MTSAILSSPSSSRLPDSIATSSFSVSSSAGFSFFASESTGSLAAPNADAVTPASSRHDIMASQRLRFAVPERSR